MEKEETICLDGHVSKILRNMVLVNLENNIEIVASICGKMQMRNIRVIVGDKVKVEMSSYDLTKGRIVYRYR